MFTDLNKIQRSFPGIILILFIRIKFLRLCFQNKALKSGSFDSSINNF